MLIEEYKEKLRGFNATPKYKKEMNFLGKLLDIRVGDKLLDYGCGLGNTMHYMAVKYSIRAFGFDVNPYYEGDPFYFKDSLFFVVDRVYFMHSLAHIADPPLKKLKDKFLTNDGKIVVITPNREWLDKQDKTNYTPDPTVVKHFSLAELQQLFIDAGFSIEISGEFGVYPNNNERLFLVAVNS